MAKLLSNKWHLRENIKEFLDSHDKCILLSAYITKDTFQEVIETTNGKIDQVVVRWSLEDIIANPQYLDLFEYTSNNKIALYRNTKLHGKCLIADNNDCILGSANYTFNGLTKSKESNWEVNTSIKEIDFKSRSLVNQIINESILINEELVSLLKDTLEKIDRGEINDQEEIDYNNKHFLLSALPMTNHPVLLWELYNEDRILHMTEMNAAAHDVALYKLLYPTITTEEEFLSVLKERFNAHPFIQNLKTHIKEQGSVRYGGVVKWIQSNCTEVPIPRSWQIKERQIVNILYDWICYFDNTYSYHRPSYSQVIFYNI